MKTKALKGEQAFAPGFSRGLLQALHILTRDGQINQDSRRKLKQVEHLIALLRPALDAVSAEDAPLVADLGAGKSYLGFLIYDAAMRDWERGRLVAVEARADLAASGAALAAAEGFDRMRFVAAPIGSDAADAALGGARASMVTALHACDTATDDAIRFALKHDARFVALVPCCQAEAAALLGAMKGPLEALWRHPIQRRGFGAHVTNTIRALYLEAHGYKVRVTEFTGFEHTQKNELILAERVQRTNGQARAQLDRLLAGIPLKLGLLED
jgi:hypothetical protein